MARRRNVVTKNLKDYIVPIIGVFIVLLILISLFSGWEENVEVQKENKVGIALNLDGQSTQGTIEYSNGDKLEINQDSVLMKWETINVSQWSLVLDIPEVGNARVSKLGIIDYNADGSFTHSSWNFWVNTSKALNVKMKFARVKMWENSHVSMSQNEMASTVYVISGFVEVENLVGQNTLVLPGEKVSITTINASNEDLDLKAQKEQIDDVFKNDDWYILNRGDSYINAGNDEDESDDETNSNIPATGISTSRVMLFDTIRDEATIDSSNITITGNYTDDNIVKITANNQEAQLNTQNKSFTFDNISTSKYQNDIVFRAYDDAEDILEKNLITLYYLAGESTGESGWYNLQNYENVDASQYTFTAPSVNTTYTTNVGQVTIQGKVNNPDIANVLVNGYKLNSYAQNLWTWKYHAFENFNTLSKGTNVYDVEYLDASENVVYTNRYTIVWK